MLRDQFLMSLKIIINAKLEKLTKLQYHNEHNRVFLFKYYWYDTTDRGIRVDLHHGLVN
jgi:hypothetical protein